jgi:hypothetical protein
MSQGVSLLRTPTQVRTTAFIAYALAIVAALLVSFVVHALFGSQGRGGFMDLNFGGILETLAFVFTFSNALLLARVTFHLPISTLMTCGILTPPPAKNFAQKLETLENPSTLELGSGLTVLRQNGKPVGIHDGRRTLDWDKIAKISGNVAVTELRALLAKSDFVAVLDDDAFYGVITQDMFISGLWRGLEPSRS